MGTKCYTPEKDIEGSPLSIPISVLKIIIEQSEKSLCKIKCDNGVKGTGFFCIVPYPDKFHQLPVLMTNAHIIKKEDNEVKFSLNNEFYEIAINDSRRVYSNEDYDITIIEIKEKDNIKINLYLELEDNIFKENPNEIYKDKPVYLISYPHGRNLNYSYGTIKLIEEDNYTIRHLCRSNPGSSGGPIMNLEGTRVIGIHKGAAKYENWNLGTLLKEPIEIFNGKLIKNSVNKNIKKLEDRNEKIDEIIIIYKYKKNNDITIDTIQEVKKIFGETISENKIFGEHFVKKNKKICKIVVNGKERELCSYLNDINIKKESLEIKLKGISKMTDISYMFCGCISLKGFINLENWNMKNINNISCLFLLCCNIKELPDISKWNTNNVIDMNGIFGKCSKLTSLPDISKWNTNNVTNMRFMFNQCSKLTSLPDISKWNTNNVTDMGFMFYQCSKLTSLPDISKWNTNNVTNLHSIFDQCSSLTSLPDISKWNTNNVIDMGSMFVQCSKLASLPDISKWNTNNVTMMNAMFDQCLKLTSLPDISKWNTNNVTNMGCMFYRCSKLTSLPDISKWNTNNVIDMNGMFSDCSKLTSLPDISKWNTNNVTNMGFMFYRCSKLTSLPDISKWNTNNVTNMDGMFVQCSSLISLPDISKWNANNDIDIAGIFAQGKINYNLFPI